MRLTLLLSLAVLLVAAPIASADRLDTATSSTEAGPTDSCVHTGVRDPGVSVAPSTCVYIVKMAIYNVHDLVGTDDIVV